MVPQWLHTLSIIMLLLGGGCALIIIIDILAGHKQHMSIMNIVWPVTALFGTVLVLWGYYKYGRLSTHKKVMEAKEKGEEPPHKRFTPFPTMVGKGALHCGSGCTLGDICAEFLALFVPAVAVWFGWKSIFPDSPHGKIFAVWILDYIFAFGFGIAFQYFTIVPMRGLSFGKGIIQAVKADTLSLTAWQFGMYGFMAVAHFVIFTYVWDIEVKASMPLFWFMMQIAMICGFATSYPVNWWLIRRGIKEKM